MQIIENILNLGVQQNFAFDLIKVQNNNHEEDLEFVNKYVFVD